jgi:nucleoside diphosphate kinase
VKGGVELIEPAKTLKIGNTTIHIVAPQPKSQGEIKQILDDYHRAGWKIFEEMMEKAKHEEAR